MAMCDAIVAVRDALSSAAVNAQARLWGDRAGVAGERLLTARSTP